MTNLCTSTCNIGAETFVNADLAAVQLWSRVPGIYYGTPALCDTGAEYLLAVVAALCKVAALFLVYYGTSTNAT